MLRLTWKRRGLCWRGRFRTAAPHQVRQARSEQLAPQFTDVDMENTCCQLCLETGEDEWQHMSPQGSNSWSVLATLWDMAAPLLGRLLLELRTAPAHSVLLSSDAYSGCFGSQRNKHWDSCCYPTEIDDAELQDALRRYPMSRGQHGMKRPQRRRVSEHWWLAKKP